jgi:DNA primase
VNSGYTVLARGMTRPRPDAESRHTRVMRFTPRLLDDIRSRLLVSQVVSRKVALKRAGREFRGLSPFKIEKTPSFYVNDQKGFYHCFASGEHGDIFTFLMKTEGLTFAEAVEALAAEAGVVLPKPDARAVQQEDERARLQGLLEIAAKWFEANLAGAAGAEARKYVAGRGLTPEIIHRFRIGYAPPGRHALQQHLAKQGYTVEEMIRSGMLIGGEDIKEPYDRFRHRVMFPITDLKDRPIAFGGRALEKDERAKYLNSPETMLFHKGTILFNAAKARKAAHDKQRLIIVEGYMDVVSLAAAGFEETVAPLGTALTEEQMQLVWRLVPEPILCLDGDSAGRKAAHRAVDTIIPHLKPGYSAGFVFLPGGLDPDDLVRQQGPEAMEAELAKALPLAEVLWEREFSQSDWSTPERKARLQQQLRTLVDRIADPAVRALYATAMRERLSAAWGGGRMQNGQGPDAPSRTGRSVAAAAAQPYRVPPGGRNMPSRPWRDGAGPGGRPQWRGWEPPKPVASHSLRSSSIAGGGPLPPYREAMLMRTLLNHPWLLEAEAERIATLDLTSSALCRLRDALISLLSTDISLDRGTIRSQLTSLGLDKAVSLVERAMTHKADRFAEPDAAEVEVEKGWRHTLALHEQQNGLRKALAGAEEAWNAEGSEDALTRIIEIKRQLASSEDLQLPNDA